MSFSGAGAPSATICGALVKRRDGALDAQRPIARQIQLVTLSINEDHGAEDSTRSFFTQIQQLTRHLYAPVLRATGQQIEVSIIFCLRR
jgi:hypothetical protein